MSEQKIEATLNQLRKLKHLLPEATNNFIPARTDNPAIPKKNSPTTGDYSLGSLKQTALYIQNQKQYQNVKISPNSILGKEHSLILIDVDDHNDQGTALTAKELQDTLNLPTTLTIATNRVKVSIFGIARLTSSRKGF